MDVPRELFLELVSYLFYAYKANEKKIERREKKGQPTELWISQRNGMLRRITEIEKVGGDSIENLYQEALHNSMRQTKKKA